MRNFTPLLNTINPARGLSPFAAAGSSFSVNPLRVGQSLSKLGGNKMTLSGIINGAQKTIGTVNQIVPLYNQVKPMFQNSKVILNVLKDFRGKNLNTRKRLNKTIQQPNKPIDVKIQKEDKKTISPQNEPAKPFFL